MAVEEILKETISQHIGPLKQTPSGWKKRNCMLCHLRGQSMDKRERFGIIDIEGGMNINCFNCGFTTGWRPDSLLGDKMVFFLTALGVPEADVNRLKFEAFREANNIKSKEFKLRGSITAKWNEIDLIEDCHSMRFWIENECQDKDFLKAIEYTDKRSILDIDKVYWTPSKKRMFNKRFIFPFFYKGKIVGYTGRLSSEPPNKNVPKYLTEMPPSYIYGVDDQHDREFVIINEGMVDAVVTGGIGVLHNKINVDQANLINSLPGQKILCPDRDKDGDELIQTAIENKWSVAFPHWGRNAKDEPVKDASEAVELYGHLLTLKSIIDSRTSGSHAIKMKRKLDRVTHGY
jgi:hypothetical protein